MLNDGKQLQTMSLEVQQFLNDSGGNFTETAPRPPVPGEENELLSNGGTSTRSSGSHKSHLSGKSHSSGKSGSSHREERSPAATPRRSNLDKTGGSLSCSIQKLDCSEVEAPLGFEPEGSAASSPPFTENSTPPYLKWATGIRYLLDDSDGVKLFKQFLDQEQCSNQLDFWFACRGLKMVGATETGKIHNLIKLIYRKYLKGDVLNLSPDPRRNIADRIKSDNIDQTLFDEAQLEVENSMKNDTYPLFLKSDLYVQYVQTGGESPKTSNNSSGSNSVRPVSGLLPTLLEGEELKQEDLGKSNSTTQLVPLTPSALMATRNIRAAMSSLTSRRPEGAYLHSELDSSSSHSRRRHGAVNPYHISYAPVSAQDSASLSSDALTDDTMSLTDSSVDGRDVGGKKWKHRHKAMQRNAALNRSTEAQPQFIPRTERAPKDRNVAETDPQKFAVMLIERLERVKKEQEKRREDQEKTERVKESLKTIEMTDEEDQLMPPPSHPVMMRDIKNISTASLGRNVTQSSLENRKNTSTSSMGSLQLNALMATMSAAEEDENAQSILEDHCSRIWDNSTNQTPSRSPGRSPDRGHRRIPLVGPSPNVSAAMLKNLAHHKRKDKDTHSFSSMSYDSGVGEDKSGVHIDQDGHNNKYVYHHHHHHYSTNRDAKSKQMAEHDAQRRMTYYVSDPSLRAHPSSGQPGQGSWEDTTNSRGRPRDAKRSNAKKNSDSSSNIDSGVSLMYDVSPTKEKVLAWMMENEKVSSDRSTQYSTDGSDRSSHKRSSHKSSSSGTPMPHRQSSSSKKASVSYHGSSRSASLDRSGHHHQLMSTDYLHGQPMGSVMPAQPIVQDPSMPLLNPPNPTTQLEEAKRRLEDERNRMMSKSKSFGGASSKDRRSMAPPAFAPPPRTLPVNKSVINTTLDMSAEESSNSSRSERKSRKPSSSAPTTPAQGDVTVVGYYFCGEPIPYRSTIPGRSVILAQFKQLITKRGNYRYFFKKASDEFDSGVILEEVTDDNAELPLWDGKVVGKVEKVE